MLQASNLSTSVLGYFFLKFLLAFILSCLVLSLIQVLNKHCFVRCFSESITIMHPLKPSGVMAYIRPRINYTRTSNMKAQLGNKVHELFMYFPEFKPRKYVLSHFFLCSWTWQLDALAGFEILFFFRASPFSSFYFSYMVVALWQEIATRGSRILAYRRRLISGSAISCVSTPLYLLLSFIPLFLRMLARHLSNLCSYFSLNHTFFHSFIHFVVCLTNDP